MKYMNGVEMKTFSSFQIPTCDCVFGEGSGIVSPVDLKD